MSIDSGPPSRDLSKQMSQLKRTPAELPEFERALEQYIGQFVSLISAQESERLSKIFRYTALDGGQRVRPRLLLALCADFGVTAANSLPTAVAVELLHTSSLIHDDLPALDNDSLRRGKPSAHVRFGEAQAILAGDAMITVATSIIASSSIDSQQAIKIIQVLSDAFSKICLGQLLDLDEKVRRSNIELVHSMKTGALFVAVCRSVVTLAQVEEGVEVPLVRVGESFGRLFQAFDDYRDLMGDYIALGKAAPSDRRNNRTTAFDYLSPQQSSEKLAVLCTDLQSKLRDLERAHIKVAARASVKELTQTRQFIEGFVDRVIEFTSGLKAESRIESGAG